MNALMSAALAAALFLNSTGSAAAECNPDKVFVIGGTWCPPCHEVMNFLAARGVQYEFVNAVPSFYDWDAWARLEQVFGVRTVPVIATTRYFVVGSDEDQLRRFLCLAW